MNAQEYRFHVFRWLARMDGFGYPIDVYKGSIFLGTLEAFPEGVKISLVQTPIANVTVNHGSWNNYRTQDLATQALHRIWLRERQPARISA